MRNLLNFRASVLSAAALGFLLLCSAPGRSEPASDAAFFPWQKGDSWVYDTLKKGDKKPFEMKVSMEGPWKDDTSAGELSGMIMTQKDKRGTMREFQLEN